MDMRMPIMNGIEATKKIRQFNQEIPIICMSANVYREDKHAAEEAGMNDFIEKPLEKSDIESTLLGLESIQNIKHKEIIIQKNLKVRAFKHLIQYFDEEQSKKIITLAEQSIENYIKSIETNWENKDMQSLIENFHTIKGIVSNLGLNNIADNAMFLQNAAKISNLKVEPEKEALILDLKGFLVSNI
nr:response regulator [Campylobacterota bacterium]